MRKVSFLKNKIEFYGSRGSREVMASILEFIILLCPWYFYFFVN